MASNDTSTATSAVYLCFVNSSSGACNTNTGIRLGPNGAYKMDTGNPWRGQISCVATPTTTVDILYSQ
jgi:hypothetical protein